MARQLESPCQPSGVPGRPARRTRSAWTRARSSRRRRRRPCWREGNSVITRTRRRMRGGTERDPHASGCRPEIRGRGRWCQLLDGGRGGAVATARGGFMALRRQVGDAVPGQRARRAVVLAGDRAAGGGAPARSCCRRCRSRSRVVGVLPVERRRGEADAPVAEGAAVGAAPALVWLHRGERLARDRGARIAAAGAATSAGACGVPAWPPAPPRPPEPAVPSPA